MRIIQLIQQHTTLLIVLFVIGGVASYLREVRKRKIRGSRWLEWTLIPPGFAALFILIQQASIRYFAFYPKASLTLCATVAAAATLLVIVGKKNPGTSVAWLGGLLGAPSIVMALVLVGMYVQAPQRFENIKATITQIEGTEGQSAPDFPFSLVNDREERALSTYQGQWVLLNVWATWCMPCLKEMPALNRIQTEFAGKGLVVINLSDETFEKIEAYLAKNQMVTTHAQIDDAGNVPEFYRFGGARPTSFLIDPTGKVVEAVVESKNYDYFKQLVARHLP